MRVEASGSASAKRIGSEERHRYMHTRALEDLRAGLI
jgi:hypothetical protein